MHPDPLETYLRALRRELRALPRAEAQEIERELRSHVFDRLGDDRSEHAMRDVLQSLGEPRQIARVNVRMRGPQGSRSILQMLVLAGHMLVSIALSLAGYAFAACWMLAALAKPLAPDRIGLWLLPDPSGDISVSLGRHAVGAAGQDLLGWWIVPLGALIGIASAALTYRYDLTVLRRLAPRSATSASQTP